MEIPNWMEEDYCSVRFNSYVSGPGTSLPVEHLPSYKRNTTPGEMMSVTLYIRNIPADMTREGLANVFSLCGTVIRSKVGKPQKSELSKSIPTQYGFVDYATMKEAQRAIDELHRKPPLNLNIEFAMSREEREQKQKIQRDEDAKYQLQKASYPNQSYANASSKNDTYIVRAQNERSPVPFHASVSPKYSNVPISPVSSYGRGIVSMSPYPYKTIRESHSVNGTMKREMILDVPIGRGRVPRSVGRGVAPRSLLLTTCVYCSKPGSYQCMSCKSTYCSERCQDLDWPQHRHTCGTGDTNFNQQQHAKPMPQGHTASHYNEERFNVHERSPWDNSNVAPESRICPPRNSQTNAPTGFNKPLMPSPYAAKTNEQTGGRFVINDKSVQARSYGNQRNQTDSSSKFSWVKPNNNNTETSTSSADGNRNSWKSMNGSNVAKNHLNGAGDSSKSHWNQPSLNASRYGRKYDEKNAGKGDAKCTGPAERLHISGAYKPLSILKDLVDGQELKMIVVTPNVHEFWATVLLTDVVNKLSTCEKEIRTLAALSSSYRAAVGELVAAYSNDFNQWFRARVISHVDNEYSVRFVDYGSDESTKRVFLLPDRLKEIPSLTVHITIENTLSLKCQALLEKMIVPNAPITARMKTSFTSEIELLDSTNKSVLCRALALPWYYDLPTKNDVKSDKQHSENPAKKVSEEKPSPKSAWPTLTTVKKEEEKKFYVNEMATIKLTVGQKLKVQVVHVQYGESLYVQPVEDLPEIANLMEQIQNHCNNKASNSNFSPTINELVCAKFTDGMWYRARVVEVKGSSRFTVRFVDYGNESEVTVENVRPFSEHFVSTPAGSVCVKLDGIETIDNEVIPLLVAQPLSIGVLRIIDDVPIITLAEVDVCGNDVVGTVRDQPTPAQEEEHHFFLTQMSSVKLAVGQKVYAQVVHIQSGASLYVQPVEDLPKIASLMEQVQKHCTDHARKLNFVPSIHEMVCAKFSDNMWYRAYVIESKSKSSIAVCFVDYGNESEVAIEDVCPFSEVFVSTPLSSICVKIDGVEFIGDEAIPLLVAQPLTMAVIRIEGDVPIIALIDGDIPEKIEDQPNPVQEEERHFYLNQMSTAKLIVGQSDDVQVLHIQSGKSVHVQPVEDLPKIAHLMEQIQKHCTDHASNSNFAPKVNEMVCAKFTDGVWYRACVVEVKGSSSFAVRFVDCGNESKVTIEDVLPFSEDFLSTPICLVCVALDGVEALDNETVSVLESQQWTMEVVRLAGDVPMITLTTGDVCVNDVLGRVQDQLAPAQEEERHFYLNQMSTAKLIVGQSDDVQVFHIQSGKSVHVQPVEDLPKIAYLMEQIQKHCTDHSSASNFAPKVNEMVCAKFTDGVWYRACVVEVKGSSSFAIRFVDYGNESEVTIEDVLPFSEDFLSTPICLVCVALDGVEALDNETMSVLESQQWTMEVVRLAGDVPMITLTTGDVCVNDVLGRVQDQLAPAQEEERHFYLNQMSTAKLIVGQSDDVQVLHIQSGKSVHVQSVEDLPKISHLMEQIQKHCTDHSSASNFTPKVNEMVCAKFSDGVWYRACVVEVTGSSCFAVRFVDCGNESEVTIEDVLPFSEGFLSTPICLVCVELDGVEAIDNDAMSVLESQQWTMEVVRMAGDVPMITLTTGDVCVNDVLGSVQDTPIQQETGTSRSVYFVDQLAKIQLSVKQVLVVCAAYVKSAKQLYVQDFANSDQISELMAKMQEYCSSESCEEYRPQLRELVCVKFQDGIWYRASIIDIATNSRYTVHFVDFGNDHVVTEKEIRPFKEEFLSFPLFSLCVELDMVEEIDDNALAILQNKAWNMEVSALEEERVIVRLSDDNQCFNDTLVTEEKRFLRSELPQPVLTQEEKIAVEVVFVENANKTYVQLSNDRKALIELMYKIHEHCSQAENEPYCPQQDEMVCAKFSDGLWYRAHAIQPVDYQNFKMHFVDYGNENNVALQDIRPFSPEFALFPVFALCVKLDGLLQLEETTKQTLLRTWTMEVITCTLEEGAVVRLSNNEGCINDTLKNCQQSDEVKEEKMFLRKDLPETRVTIEREYDAMIMHIESAKEVYVQLTEESTKLLQLMPEIQDYCTKTVEVPDHITNDEMVCAKSNDGIWYRAHVIDAEQFEKCTVRFVDIGTKDVVSRSNIRPFVEEFTLCPVGSVCVTLDQVTVIHPNFHCILLDEKWTLEVLKCNDSRPVVNLSHSGHSIKDILAEACTKDATDSAEKQPELPMYFLADCPSSILTLGEKTKVIVTKVVLPELFFCQLSDEAMLRKLDDLNAEIGKYCAEVTRVVSPVIHTICMAFCEDKKVWLRAVVVNLEPLMVMFPDYGNTSLIEDPQVYLRAAKPEFILLPWQAIKCSLAGIKYKSSWDEKVLEELNLLLPSGRVVEVTAIKSEDADSFVVNIPFVRKSLLDKRLVEDDNTLPLKSEKGKEELKEELEKHKLVVLLKQKLLLKKPSV